MTTIQAGDKAPTFKGVDQDGNPVSLKDFKGKKLVVFFYPKDGTPTCTVEACNIRDSYQALQKAGYEVLGVSPDSQKKHQNFIAKHELPYNLISDPEKEVANAFEVWGPKKFMGRISDAIHRTTFLIDEKGKVERVIGKVKAKEHSDQILAAE